MRDTTVALAPPHQAVMPPVAAIELNTGNVVRIATPIRDTKRHATTMRQTEPQAHKWTQLEEDSAAHHQQARQPATGFKGTPKYNPKSHYASGQCAEPPCANATRGHTGMSLENSRTGICNTEHPTARHARHGRAHYIYGHTLPQRHVQLSFPECAVTASHRQRARHGLRTRGHVNGMSPLGQKENGESTPSAQRL